MGVRLPRKREEADRPSNFSRACQSRGRSPGGAEPWPQPAPVGSLRGGHRPSLASSPAPGASVRPSVRPCGPSVRATAAGKSEEQESRGVAGPGDVFLLVVVTAEARRRNAFRDWILGLGENFSRKFP